MQGAKAQIPGSARGVRLRAIGRPRRIPGGALHIRDQLHLVPGKLGEGQADHYIFPPVPCPVIDARGDLDDRNSRWQNRQTAMLARTRPGPAGARGTPGRALGWCAAIYTKPSYSPLDVALAASCILRLFSLSVWPRSWRTGRKTRHHWALACRTGRTSRRIRRMAYCSRSLSRRATWHGSHTVPPSMGGCVPQRVHVRASRRAQSRRLPLSRANSRHRSGSLPPYGMPAALAFAHLARSALRRFSPQCRHKVRSGAGLAFPHLGHMPRVIRSAVMRSYRRRPHARSFSGSLYGMFLPSAVVVRAKDARPTCGICGRRDIPGGRPFSAPCAYAPRIGPLPPIPNTGCRNRRSSRRCTR